MAPDSISALGEVLKQYMLPAGLIALGIVVIASFLLGGTAIFGLYGFGRAVTTAVLWQPKPTLDHVVRALRAGVPLKPSDYESSLSFDGESFALESCREAATPKCIVSWNCVRRVVAFRRELFKCDCACLRLHLANGAEMEVNEGVKGWTDFVNAMPVVLPGSMVAELRIQADALPCNVADAVVIYDRIKSDGA